jgi:hypothetical protein
MIKTILTGITGLFSSSKLQDVAIDGIRKLGGLNGMTDKEKSEYILTYMDKTKHQSPMRRLIAFMLTLLFGIFSLTWLTAAAFGYYLDITASLEFAGAIRNYFESVIREPFTWIVSFYFVIDLATKLKSNT